MFYPIGLKIVGIQASADINDKTTLAITANIKDNLKRVLDSHIKLK